MRDTEIRHIVAGTVRPVRFQRGNLRLVDPELLDFSKVPVPRDLPATFWHPSMGATGEEAVAHDEKDDEVDSGEEELELLKASTKEQSFTAQLVGVTIAACFILLLATGTFWAIAQIIKNL